MTSERKENERIVTLTQEEAAWLESAARRGSTDTVVPGAAEQLRALAKKLRAASEVTDDQ